MGNEFSDNLTDLLRASGLGHSGSAAEQLTSMSYQLQQLRAINDGILNEAIAQQVAALAAPVSSNGWGAGVGGVLGAAGNWVGGGLGLSPLISGLAGLFGGGEDASGPPPLVPYMKPRGLHVDAGFSDTSGGKVFAVDAGQGSAPRAVTYAAPAQITIQVQAMDSRSFLDRSQDIAMAVRQAMLETTVLNDVIREV